MEQLGALPSAEVVLDKLKSDGTFDQFRKTCSAAIEAEVSVWLSTHACEGDHFPIPPHSPRLGHMVSTLRCSHGATCKILTGERAQPGTRYDPNYGNMCLVSSPGESACNPPHTHTIARHTMQPLHLDHLASFPSLLTPAFVAYCDSTASNKC